jgi:hypothetical protein
MGHSDGDHGSDLSADDSPWSEGSWSDDDDEVRLSSSKDFDLFHPIVCGVLFFLFVCLVCE